MSEALKRIDEFAKSVLRELYHKCTAEQQERFWRLYPGTTIDDFPKDKIRVAIHQIERTIIKNGGNKKWIMKHRKSLMNVAY